MRTWPMEAHHCSRISSILVPQSRPQPSPWRFLPLPHFLNPKPFSSSRIYFSTKYPRWDSNAETLRDRKFKFSFRGKGEDDDDDDDDDDEAPEFGNKRRWWSDEPPGIKEGSGGFWEETIDSVWIFKVFKSYGWTFPIIIISWLVASGPKAFLMALALPLGQSALALAFEKLWGSRDNKSKPKRKSRMRKKPFASASTQQVKQEPEEETQRSRKRKTSYQSWVDNNTSVYQNEASFGGWDDLDGFGPSTRSSNGSERMPEEKGKLSKRVRKNDKPLLVRLLIALFPFLGTWTKML